MFRYNLFSATLIHKYHVESFTKIFDLDVQTKTGAVSSKKNPIRIRNPARNEWVSRGTRCARENLTQCEGVSTVRIYKMVTQKWVRT